MRLALHLGLNITKGFLPGSSWVEFTMLDKKGKSMKRKFLFAALLISVISLLVIAASIKIMSINEGDNFSLITLSDSSSVIVNKTDGYQFVVNNDWYPLLYPPTEEDVASFKKTAEQNNVLPAIQMLNELSSEEVQEQAGNNAPFIFLDLNPDHYVNEAESGAALLQFDLLGADFLPINELVEKMQSDEKVSNFNQLEKNNQVVYVFQLNLGTQIYYYKVAIFARNNSLTFFFVGTDNPEIFPDLSSFFDETINSLEFYDVK
jgi:hypothetical protein